MRIVVIEDEKPAARLLVREIERCGFQVAQILYSVREAIDWFKKEEEPDLIFADIQLVDGLSFDIFEALTLHSSIIFTTAYDEYALRAFKFNSLDYLLKPIDQQELMLALDKYRTFNKALLNLGKVRERYLEINYRKRFLVRLGIQVKIVETQEVECVFIRHRGVFIHLNSNRNYLLDQDTLEEVMAELDPSQFFRVNRKQIISLAAIREISVYLNSRLKIGLKTYSEDDIIVSRERVNDFKNWLSQKKVY
ncbi:LytTR family DNA-binding domain-containing protein [Flavobacterium sp. NKUCC04_CG]|uniref:LytR/AlgR family response regulator transcription factor n=1 Tax=Flavobacterium sp. NKUCC04_CG TaxID=2842121 RepID=UPI001C5A5D1D|nr:LytTR family DNA-binding domain-containing protein [Flavobacterium sp. NKUCC04_CG]MBW3517712.1 LytTR family DNA-binding domain-containing protein [Flavobacterium sp. NKUCC04_CG]